MSNRFNNSTSASLAQKVHEHLLSLGFAEADGAYTLSGAISKQKIRDLHSQQRIERIEGDRAFVSQNWLSLSKWFASGSQVVPHAISPELVEVKSGTQESRLFRLASLLWSVPVSRGFGRRMRFLVVDRSNGCLIGLFALGDPVFNLTARDKWVDWTHDDRRSRLVHVMDAYVVGAVPPYSLLIGGKLVGALMCSNEVKRVYEKKYVGRKSVISEKENRARLALITTSSALGRSSIYNRLKIPGGASFIRIGQTKGFGHFHLSGGLFDALRSHLESIDHPYASGHGFGMGPNWKLRVARAALEDIGIRGDGVLKHGVQREVYGIPLASNWREILHGEHTRLRSIALPADDIASYCLGRWVVPRSSRDPSFKHFSKTKIQECLHNGGPGPRW